MSGPGYGVPQTIWTHNDDHDVESQMGCATCLFEGVDTPLARVFLWGGTSLCAKHLLALRTPNAT